MRKGEGKAEFLVSGGLCPPAIRVSSMAETRIRANSATTPGFLDTPAVEGLAQSWGHQERKRYTTVSEEFIGF
jgi:hypothetical protein